MIPFLKSNGRDEKSILMTKKTPNLYFPYTPQRLSVGRKPGETRTAEMFEVSEGHRSSPGLRLLYMARLPRHPSLPYTQSPNITEVSR